MDRADLLRIADRCRRGLELEPADRLDLAVALGGWAAGSYPTLDAAFGLKRGAGQRSNRTVHDNLQRDALIRRCAIECYARSSNPAGEIVRDAARYESTAWRRDRAKLEMPSNYAGTPRAFFFDILHHCGAVPNSERQIRRILQSDNADMNGGDFMSAKVG